MGVAPLENIGCGGKVRQGRKVVTVTTSVTVSRGERPSRGRGREIRRPVARFGVDHR
jgi:hypothetical protein